MKKRCAWALDDPFLTVYHDEEWGEKVSEDIPLFELLTLELFQTGLSWRTILHKREAFREVFQDFDIEKVAQFGEDKVAELVQDQRIVRHRGKINATIHNANVALDLIQEWGSLNNYIENLPDTLEEKQKQMRKTFKHVGPSVSESFLIAGGFIPTPHDKDCFLAGQETKKEERQPD
jgi:DNA-3-methyladenine glycosylase I